MRPVFADASSIILLENTGLFGLFLSVYPVTIAASVFREITRPGYPGSERFARAGEQGNFTIVRPPVKNGICKNGSGFGRLDTGEKDTLSLFLQAGTGFVITDDGPAARFCHNRGIPFINALLVPKIFWHAGMIGKDMFIRKTETLEQTGRYSKAVLTIARKMTLNALAPFLPEEQ